MIENQTNVPSSNSNLLTAADVAVRLNISKGLAYQLMATGELPTVRIRNKLVRVYEPDLEKYILNARSASCA